MSLSVYSIAHQSTFSLKFGEICNIHKEYSGYYVHAQSMELEYRRAGIFRRGLIFAVFAVGHRPRKFNPRIIYIHVQRSPN